MGGPSGTASEVSPVEERGSAGVTPAQGKGKRWKGLCGECGVPARPPGASGSAGFFTGNYKILWHRPVAVLSHVGIIHVTRKVILAVS